MCRLHGPMCIVRCVRVYRMHCSSGRKDRVAHLWRAQTIIILDFDIFLLLLCDDGGDATTHRHTFAKMRERERKLHVPERVSLGRASGRAESTCGNKDSYVCMAYTDIDVHIHTNTQTFSTSSAPSAPSLLMVRAFYLCVRPEHSVC